MIGKRGQFFILSAVIIATIMVGFASIRNSAASIDSPNKFYSYNQQLEKEIAQVIENGIYQNNYSVLENFIQRAISLTLQNYPNTDIFICYTSTLDKNNLTCQNNGTTNVTITLEKTPSITFVQGQTEEITITSKRNMTLIPSNLRAYEVNLSDPDIQPLQFHFISKTTTKSGEYIYLSKD